MKKEETRRAYSCDTFLAQGKATKQGQMIFGKNSDRYMGEAALPSSGRMVCLDCGRAFPLECSHLEELTRHIQSDHQFEVDTRHTVLYGHCCDCGK